jgi:hypothetical protein
MEECKNMQTCSQFLGEQLGFSYKISRIQLFDYSTDFRQQYTDRLSSTSDNLCKHKHCSEFHYWGANGMLL